MVAYEVSTNMVAYKVSTPVGRHKQQQQRSNEEVVMISVVN